MFSLAIIMKDTQPKIITESLRIEKETLDRVREHIKKSKHTIGGFVTMIVSKEMDRIDKRKKHSCTKLWK